MEDRRLFPAQDRRPNWAPDSVGLPLASARPAGKLCTFPAGQGVGNPGAMESCSLDCSSLARSGL